MTELSEIACVSIVVSSIDDVLPAYVDGLGLEAIGERQESKRGYGMRWQELGRNGKAFLELIEPTGDGGPISQFLGRNPTSHVYQFRFMVDDLTAALEEFGSRGLKVLRGPTVEGQPDVGWVHPKSTGGALIELVERQT